MFLWEVFKLKTIPPLVTFFEESLGLGPDEGAHDQPREAGDGGEDLAVPDAQEDDMDDL